MYIKLVGKLNFVTNTRSDLAFTVQYLSQFTADPGLPHFEAAMHTLRHVKVLSLIRRKILTSKLIMIRIGQHVLNPEEALVDSLYF